MSGLLDKKFIVPYFAKISDHLAELYLHHGEYSVNGLSHIWNHFDGTHILAISPKKGLKLPGQLTKNRKRLGKGFLAGLEAVLNHLTLDEHSQELIIANFKRELNI